MALIDAILMGAYGLVAALLAVFALHRIGLALAHRRARHQPAPRADWEGPLPSVTVQVPIFNELEVVERTIAAACALDWPRDRLEIQILDDSTDETRALAEAAIATARARGIPIRHVTRSDRRGYKAGALDHGLRQASGEFVAVFDADFIPPPEFLRRVMAHFGDDGIGMVQARWGHLNRDHSLLTRLQALLLDGHFEVEHLTRNRTGRFFNFNGTAGVWRRTCIEAAGGWEHDTLTEDLDLSYRAQLAGWRFLYLNDVHVPAELPVQVRAFKTQQHRWTKGAIQTGRKLLPRIWSSQQPVATKIEASFHLLDHFASVVVLLFTVFVAPALLLRRDHLPPELARLIGAGFLAMSVLALGAFYGTAARHRAGGLRASLALIPLIIPLIAGLGVTTLRAVLEGLFGNDLTFVRTPKVNAVGREVRGRMRYRVPLDRGAALELALGLHHGVIAVFSLQAGWLVMGTFFVLFSTGFFWIGAASLVPGRPRARQALA